MSTITQPIEVAFRHSFKLPTGVTGLAGADNKHPASRYESLVTVSGGLSGNFKGSIYPDNMNDKGRIWDGSYDLYLGFHHNGHPTAKDLVVRTNGFRAVLVVNANGPVLVTSNSARKYTSNGIHIHNGYSTWHTPQIIPPEKIPPHQMSEGCLLIAPSDWPRFIKLFLHAFPNLADWTAGGVRLGRKIGCLTVSSF